MIAAKTHFACFTVAACLLFSQPLSAQILFTEDFAYNTGALAGQWTSQCSGLAASVVSPGLTYTGYGGSNQGNALRVLGSGNEYRSVYKATKLQWPYYLGMLVNVKSTGPGGGSTCGNGMNSIFNFKLHTASTNLNVNTGFVVKSLASNQFQFGMQDVSGLVLASPAYSFNTTYLVVIELTQTSYKVYVNPALGSAMPAPDIILPVGPNEGVESLQIGQNSFGEIILDGLLFSNRWSDVVQSVLAPEPLSPPTALQFSNVSTTGFSAQYTNAPGNSSGTLVVRRTGATPQFVPVNGTSYAVGQSVGNGETIVVPGGCCSFVESALNPQEQYHYRIFSFNQTGAAVNTTRYLTSAYLDGNRFTLSSPPTAKPSSFTAQSISTNAVMLSFPSANSITNADGYLILRRDDGNNPSAQNILYGMAPSSMQLPAGTSSVATIQSTQVSNLTDTGLASGSLYKYAIVPFNWDGTHEGTYHYYLSEPLSTASALTFPEAPTQPVSTAISQQGFACNWNPVNGATAYSIEISADNFASVLTTVPGIATTTHTVSGLSKGTSYKYAVRAHNGSGPSERSIPSNVLTLPAAPTNPTISQILVNSFVVNWTPAAGVVDHYELEISKDDFVSFVAGYGPKIIGSAASFDGVPELTASTFYKFRVRAVNASGYSEYTGGGAYTLAKNIPVLQNPTVTERFDGSPISISVQVANASDNSRITLKHRKITLGGKFTVEPLTQSAGRTEAIIDGSKLDELGMEFYLVAEDGAWKDSTALRKIYPVFNDVASPTFISGPFGGEFADYRMVSIPYELNDNFIESIFGKALGGYDARKWRFGHYENGSIQEAGNGINKIARGKSYWFNARSTSALSIQTGGGEAPKNDSAHPYQLVLQRGWNQIGNPYPFAIKWTDVLEANPDISGIGQLKTFSRGAYAHGDQMPVYSGGFVFADQAVTLSIPVTLRAPGSARHSGINDAVAPVLTAESWQLNLHLQQDEHVSSLGGFGMHPDALQGKDNFDDLNLPRFNDHLEVVFHHPEFFYSSFSRDIVSTSERHTWKFTVESSQAAETELRWPAISKSIDGPVLFLLDVSACAIIDMSEQTSYIFDTTEKGKDFQVFFSSDSKSELLFDTFEVGQAYPNPSSGSVTIPFLLPEEKSFYDVEISICDLTGRVVRTLAYDQVTSGLHNAMWDGADGAGTLAASGVYIYKLRVDRMSHRTARRLMIER